jgi:hypothetical protein
MNPPTRTDAKARMKLLRTTLKNRYAANEPPRRYAKYPLRAVRPGNDMSTGRSTLMGDYAQAARNAEAPVIIIPSVCVRR